MEILKSAFYLILMVFGSIVACIFSNILLEEYERKISAFLKMD